MARPAQEEIEEGYKQVRLNARCKALDIVHSNYVAATGGNASIGKEMLDAEQMVKQAKIIEEYMLEGISPPPAPSTIMRATVGPH